MPRASGLRRVSPNRNRRSYTAFDNPKPMASAAATIARAPSGSATLWPSATAVRSLLDDYPATHASWPVKQSVGTILKSTNDWLYAQSQKQDADDGGMATTLSCLVLKGGMAHFFHAGDTRIWRLRGRPRGSDAASACCQYRPADLAEPDPHRRLYGLALLHLEIDLRQQQVERDRKSVV